MIPARAESPPGIGPLIELLRVLLKQRCEDFQVAQKLVASADDLVAIAADDNAPVPALSAEVAAEPNSARPASIW